MAGFSRGRGPFKLIASQRGQGVLRIKAAELQVAYHVDRYLTAAGETVSGEVDGVLSTLPGLADGDKATLVLDSGVEVPVALFQVEADGADIETPGV